MTTSVLIAERLLFISSNLCVLLASWSLTRLLVDRHSVSTRIMAIILGFPLIAIPTSTLLGVFGLLTPWAAFATAGIEAIVLTTLALRRSRQTFAVRFSISKREWLLTGTATAVLLLLAEPILTKQLLQASQFHWDDFSYHAPKAAHWLQAERITLAPFSYHSYYPGNAELFCAWFMLPSHLDAFSSLASVYWLLLGVVVVIVTCRQLEVSPSIAVFAGAIFLVARPFRFNAGSFAAVDLAGSVLAAAAVGMALPAVSQREPKSTLGPIVYCASAFGLAVGCKITFAPIAAIVLFWLLIAHRSEGIAKLGKIVGLFGACALLCGGFWYIRNWVVTGNPVFPADVWSFEGPLDAQARKQTSLVYQLSLLDAKGFDEALKKLLNWPSHIAFVLLAGYGITALSLLWPRAWRHSISRRVMVIALIGLAALAAAAFGPFSGTVNDPRGGLHIRLRFYLCFGLIAIPLVGYWIDRTRRVRSLFLLFGLLFISDTVRMPFAATIAFGLAGAAVGWMISGGYLEKMRRFWRPIAIAVCFVVTVALHYAMQLKQPRNDRWLSKQTSGWNALDVLPDGSRVAWFATFEDAKYYRAFGRRLRLVPVKMLADGRAYLNLHEEWRTAKKTWWQPWRRKYHMKKYVDNLFAQGIEYVYLMKRRKGEWPPQYKILIDSKRALRVIDYPSYAIFELRYPSERKVHQ